LGYCSEAEGNIVLLATNGKDANSPLWKPLAIWAAHLVVLIFAVWIGFFVEALLDGPYQYTRLAAFAPWMSATACAVGLCVNRVRKDWIAMFVWIAGVSLLAFAIWDEGRWWDYTWVHESKRQYLMDSFFGDARHCASSECVAQIFFTAPCVASIAYSIGAAIGLVIPRKRRARRRV
jgi:hypothetical protein